MKTLLQDTLDELVSPNSTSTRVDKAFTALERLLAEVCVSHRPDALERLYIFIDLQGTFDCNVPSRILTWMAGASARLERILARPLTDQERESEVVPLARQLTQALSILQGVALIHEPSKHFLCRRYPLEVLLDLLLTSRRVSSVPISGNPSAPSSPGSIPSRSASPSNGSSVPLTSAVLDTLLCILVDSSPALRVFEELSGVQYVVRILKRAGTPREVRMKCLEFLYFYLLDETTLSNARSGDAPDTRSTSPGITGTPTPPTQYPRRPIPPSSHSTTSSTSSTRSSSSSSSDSSVSTSATSIASAPATPNVSRESSTTSASSSPCTPPLAKPIFTLSPRTVTPPQSRAQPCSLHMLRRDVDYVPQTPKREPIPRFGPVARRNGGPHRPRHKSRGTMDALSSETSGDEVHTSRPSRPSHHPRGLSVSAHRSATPTSVCTPAAAEKSALVSKHRRAQSCADVGSLGSPFQLGSSGGDGCVAVASRSGARTMEEKKEILGSMLGNVDALVEGVRKAGIWGLG